MHYPSPQWLAKVDGLHPHLAQQMADAREFHQKVMVFHPKEGESCSVPKDRRNAWTLAASPLTRQAQVPRRSTRKTDHGRHTRKGA
jgi:hypothetical protein